MANRLSALRAQVDPILTTFAAGFNPPQNLIGRQVAPMVRTMTEAGTYYTFGKEGLQVYSSERALRANPNRIDWEPSKATFLCVEHALETMYDFEELDQAAKIGAQRVLMMEQRAIQLVQNPLELEMEKAIADTVLSGTYYATGNKATLTGNDQWMQSDGSEGSTSNPIGDIRDGIDAARNDMGRRPNTMVMGYDAWRALRDHSQMIERIKYSQRGIATTQLVAEIFNLRNVFVGESVYSADGSTFTDLWGDNVALLYIPETGEMVEGTTPHTVVFEQEGFPKVQTYADAYRKFYAVQRKYQVKNINTSYGYLLLDVKA